MRYLERRLEARMQPATVLAGARAALCVALQYHPLDGEREPASDLWPRVARYARGRDYHEVMGERLRALAARIAAAFPGTASRPYVDTGPVLERELAARAGLGAIGKNTNLLHRQAGSWFLLGEVFPTLDLAPKAAGAAHPELGLPAERGGLDLVGLLRLDRDGYVARFRGSPMKRAKQEGLQRNAAVAMGNCGDRRYVPALAVALGAAESAVVRGHAAWALGRMGGAAARESLAAALEGEGNQRVRAEIAAALAACGEAPSAGAG